MALRRIEKKILKITGIVLGLFAVLLVGFHFWLQAHARKMIEDMVASKSHGKLKLKIGKLRFSYFSKKIELENAVFYNTDTTTGTTAYTFEVDRIRIRAKAILPIVFKNQLLIDSLNLLNPHIGVARLRNPQKSDTLTAKKDVSIPEEMGKVYKSIQDALALLQVKRFEIDNGTFTLTNRMAPEELPLKVSNIYFHIDNFQVDDKRTGTEKIFFSDNVVLVSSNQDIGFPDGRHRLSFRNFRINLKKKLVEFDSCTIAATRGDSASASFNVFFRNLMLTNIDFDTLYKSEVIKADSVYCLDPTFNLEVDVTRKKDAKRSPPKLETIIQQLTGNLLLGNVAVDNASFHIKTMNNGVPSTFTFSNNNFEMQGLTIDQQAARPIAVRNFIMAIRNYDNFIKDSAYNVKFDSVLFKDNRITLSNFLFTKLDGKGKVLNTFSIPQFNLLGLSWDDLVFDRKLKADQAILFNPHINYSFANSNNKRGRQSIFESFGIVNEYMDLQQIDIIDGAIDLQLKNNGRIRLDNTTLSIKSHSLLESRKFAGIKNSLLQLRFDKGTLHAGALDITLDHLLYLGSSGQFAADHILVNNKQQATSILLDGVTVQKMQVDEKTGYLTANKVRWQKGAISLNGIGVASGGKGPSFHLDDVQGGPTTLNSQMGTRQVRTQLDQLSIAMLEKKPAEEWKLEGLNVTGKQLLVEDKDLYLTAARYSVRDNAPSRIDQLEYRTPTTHIQAPDLAFTPHITALLDKQVAIDAVTAVKPVIQLQFPNKPTGTPTLLPTIKISSIRLVQPEWELRQERDSGSWQLQWFGLRDPNAVLNLSRIEHRNNKTTIGQLDFYLTNFLFHNSKGREISTGEGKVSALLQRLQFEKNDIGATEWSANVSSFDARDFMLDSIGKNNGNLVLHSGTIDNLDIGSATILNMQRLASINQFFRVSKLTGQFRNNTSELRWTNASFNRNENTFRLDSFAWNPVLSRDSFMARQTYQKDYSTIRFGSLKIGPVDLDTYIRDKTLNARSITIDSFYFTDYKDRRLPFNAGIIKPLAVDLIQRIPQKLSIDSVNLTNANVVYTELSEKSGRTGTIPITRMDVQLKHLRNFGIREDDSLSIHATGYVMDTAWLRLHVKESYRDSLGGFLMTMRMKPVDLRLLNPALIPLASARIETGYLDTLTMRAVGREYLAWGEMQMYYHDLKIRLLKDSDEKKKSLLKNVLSFLANSFVIKNKNTSRTGNVFFIRQRDRSAFNYLLRIALSGMSSSVGVKNNKKLLRRYKRELHRRALPPVELD